MNNHGKQNSRCITRLTVGILLIGMGILALAVLISIDLNPPRRPWRHDSSRILVALAFVLSGFFLILFRNPPPIDKP